MADWPVTVNEYAAGSLCNSSEYKADFEKLRNAVNSLHARFSTLCFTATLSDYIPNTTTDYHAVSDNEELSTRRVLGIYQVPTWAQAFRVRQFDVLNGSAMRGTGNVTMGTDEGFTIGLSYATSLSALDAEDGNWSATLIKQYTGTTATPGHWVLAMLNGYENDDADESPALLTDSGLSTVVAAGSYIAIWVAGGFTTGATGSKDKNINFHCTAWLDAMVPIP